MANVSDKFSTWRIMNDSKKEVYARLAVLLALWLVSSSGVAQHTTPGGVWKTFNERTGEADGLVRITETAGELVGQVTAVFSPPADSPNPLCEECTGELKNKPVIGMTILRGLRWNGEEYSGGTILDPDNGKVYKCAMRLVDSGRKLEVRGYVGIALFGRTQVWERAE
jgi:uncharacterized protein (DUF2147 family)